MKKLLLISCIFAAYPAYAESSLYHDQEINQSGHDMMKKGLNSIKFALNEGKNGTQSIFCQHKVVPKFKELYLKNPTLVSETIIEDDIFKSQFNEIYSNYEIEPDYKYSFLQYKGTAMEFFQHSETIIAFCDIPKFRSQLNMMLDRAEYLQKFN